MSKKRDASAVEAAERPRKSSKKARVYTPADAELAQIYNGLADESSEERINAASALVTKTAEWFAKVADTDRLGCLTEHRKLIIRLARGLCSNRKAARMGFFTALTEVLGIIFASNKSDQSLSPVTRNNLISEVRAIILEQTQAEAGASKQEVRDYLLGRLSGLNAILCSRGTLVDSGTTPSLTTLIADVCQLAKEKTWLQQECGMILLDHIRRTDDCDKYALFAKPTMDAIVANGFVRTPEGVAIWLEAMDLFGTDAEMPKNVWHREDPFDKRELATTFKILKRNVATEDDPSTSNKQQGARQHKAHFALETIWALERIETEKDKDLAKKFWVEVFDQNFFAPSASVERKAIGFQAFADLVVKADSRLLSLMFSENFMKSLMNQSSKKERMLHNAARRTLEAVCQRARDDGSVILQGLVLQHGSMAFDKITGTKTVQQILAETNDKQASRIVDFLNTYAVRSSDQDDKAILAKCHSAADFMLTMVRCRTIPQDANAPPIWVGDLFGILASVAYLSNAETSGSRDTPKGAKHETTRKIYHSRLMSCLAHLASRKLEDKFWRLYPFLPIKMLYRQRSNLAVPSQADEGVKNVIMQAFTTLKDDQAPDANTAGHVLLQVLATALYQALSGDVEAINLLSEIKQLREDVISKEGDEDAVGAVMDIIMDFASRQSAIHRQLAEQTFETFCDQIQPHHLDIMLEVLQQKESVAGQQALFDPKANNEEEEEGPASEDDSGSDDSSEGINGVDINNIEHDTDDSDVEMLENNSHSSSSSSSAASSSDDDSSSEDEDDEDSDNKSNSPDIPDEELEAFNAALAKTLRTNPAANSDDSASDSDMSDNAMLALEPALTSAFRARAATSSSAANSKRRQSKDARQNISAFKNRVLDLLEVFVRIRAASGICVRIIVPVLQCIRSTSVKQISDRCAHLLRLYIEHAKKGKGIASSSRPLREEDYASVSDLWAFIRAVHSEALLFGSKAHAASCGSASLFLARNIVDTAGKRWEKEMDKLDALYAETNTRRRKLKSGLPATFGGEWWAWSGSYRPAL